VSEPIEGTGTPRSETKYGDRLEDDQWDDPDSEPEAADRTSVTDHEVDVIYHTDPDQTDGYGREKYSATIRYDDETGEPYVLSVVEHRWKGNYWRDVTDWDWRDVPEPVRQRVAATLRVENPDQLDSGTRLMDEGGESRWQKHHKHRVEAMSGGEMWGLSYLRDAVRNLDRAADAFEEGSSGERIAEKVVTTLRKAVRGLEATDTEADR